MVVVSQFGLYLVCRLSYVIVVLSCIVDFMVTFIAFYFVDSISIAVIFIENRLPVGNEMQTSSIPTGMAITCFHICTVANSWKLMSLLK